jgi:lipopolysaccharide biosynthesis glycosyltransferase
VFCARPLQLESVRGRIDGFAGRPVATMDQVLRSRENAYKEFDWSFERVRDTLGLHEGMFQTRYEVNSGVVFWNNVAMAQLGLFEKATEVFRKCEGCFESDQDLLTFTAAAYDVPLFELGDPWNFNFFEDSLRVDKQLRDQVRRGEFSEIYIVHYVWCKPWMPAGNPPADQAHFINAWREFILSELNNTALDLFEDLSVIRFNPIVHRVKNWVHVRGHMQRVRSQLGRCARRVIKSMRQVYGCL